MHNQCSGFRTTNQQDCPCQCRSGEKFLSKKKKIEALKNYLAEMEDKTEDIKEYIKELEMAD